MFEQRYAAQPRTSRKADKLLHSFVQAHSFTALGHFTMNRRVPQKSNELASISSRAPEEALPYTESGPL